MKNSILVLSLLLMFSGCCLEWKDKLADCKKELAISEIKLTDCMDSLSVTPKFGGNFIKCLVTHRDKDYGKMVLRLYLASDVTGNPAEFKSSPSLMVDSIQNINLDDIVYVKLGLQLNNLVVTKLVTGSAPSFRKITSSDVKNQIQSYLFNMHEDGPDGSHNKIHIRNNFIPYGNEGLMIGEIEYIDNNGNSREELVLIEPPYNFAAFQSHTSGVYIEYDEVTITIPLQTFENNLSALLVTKRIMDVSLKHEGPGHIIKD